MPAAIVSFDLLTVLSFVAPMVAAALVLCRSIAATPAFVCEAPSKAVPGRSAAVTRVHTGSAAVACMPF